MNPETKFVVTLVCKNIGFPKQTADFAFNNLTDALKLVKLFVQKGYRASISEGE